MMIKEVKILILITYLVSFTHILQAQSALSIKASTLSYNFTNNNYPEYLDYNLDKKGKLVFEPLLIIGYERFFSDLPLSVRLSQGVGFDAAGNFAGLTQCKLFLSIFRQWKSAINVSAGPGLYYRQKWNYPSYNNEDNGYSNISNNLEMSNYYLSLGVEYNYSLNKNMDLSFSLNHFRKTNIHFIIGLRYWISKDGKRKFKCLTCPDFH